MTSCGRISAALRAPGRKGAQRALAAGDGVPRVLPLFLPAREAQDVRPHRVGVAGGGAVRRRHRMIDAVALPHLRRLALRAAWHYDCASAYDGSAFSARASCNSASSRAICFRCTWRCSDFGDFAAPTGVRLHRGHAPTAPRPRALLARPLRIIVQDFGLCGVRIDRGHVREAHDEARAVLAFAVVQKLVFKGRAPADAVRDARNRVRRGATDALSFAYRPSR